MSSTLVTGATGLVGHAIVSGLVLEGRKVRALVRSPDKAKGMLPAAVELVQGDITDKDSVRRATEGCDVVYHPAGLPEQWRRDTGEFERVNVGGTRNMLDAAKEAKVRRFVYTSTVDVFQAKAGEAFDESKLDPEPRSTYYGRSKQNADRMVVAACEEGLDCVILHPAAVYGPGPPGNPGFNDFILRLRDKRAPMLAPGGMPVVYSEDVGRGHLLAEAKGPKGSRYILCESFYTIDQLAKTVIAAASMKRVPPMMPLWLAKTFAALGEAFGSVTGVKPMLASGQLSLLQWCALPNSDRAKRELGWTTIPFAEAVAKCLATLA